MDSIDALAQATFSGRRFTRKQLAQVQETVRVFRNLSRKELAQTVCEHLDWRTPRGANKTDCCLGLLETMQERGLVTLPAKRKADVAPKHAVALSMAEREQPFSGRLAELEPIRLERVVDDQQRGAFKASIQAHHYLGYRHPVGAQLGYFIVSQAQERRLGCVLFCSTASWELPARDQWIGWDEIHRDRLRHLVLTQQRFLIFPWIDVPHLASHVLSLSEAQLLTDWVAIYGYRPALLETFVDSSRYAGTSYQAANWKKIGQTQGKPRPTAARGALRTNKEPPTTGPKTSTYAR